MAVLTEGGTTVMEVSVLDTMAPVPAVPKLTDVALARPPPKMVMADPLASGPVCVLRLATAGHPLLPCRAMARVASSPVPSPVAAS